MVMAVRWDPVCTLITPLKGHSLPAMLVLCNGQFPWRLTWSQLSVFTGTQSEGALPAMLVLCNDQFPWRLTWSPLSVFAGTQSAP